MEKAAEEGREVRSYTSLSDLTQEEREARIKEQKKQSRQRKMNQTTASTAIDDEPKEGVGEEKKGEGEYVDLFHTPDGDDSSLPADAVTAWKEMRQEEEAEAWEADEETEAKFLAFNQEQMKAHETFFDKTNATMISAREKAAARYQSLLRERRLRTEECIESRSIFSHKRSQRLSRSEPIRKLNAVVMNSRKHNKLPWQINSRTTNLVVQL